MADIDLLQWITVNQFMRDDYRVMVVNLALRHLPSASDDLRRFAGQALSQIRVPGFRSIDRALKAPSGILRTQPIVALSMQQIPRVTTAIICLWAEAQFDVIDKLRQAAETSGFDVESNWFWHRAQDGYSKAYLDELCELAAVTAQNEAEQDDLFLAAYWLSRAVQKREGAKAMNTEEQAQPMYECPESPADLEALRQMLSGCLGRLQAVQETCTCKAEEIRLAVISGHVEQAEMDLNQLRDALAIWRSEQVCLSSTITSAAPLITREVTSREDLQVTLQETLVSIDPESPQQILDIILKIQSYDQQRNEMLETLRELIQRMTVLRTEIATLEGETIVIDQENLEIGNQTLEMMRNSLTGVMEEIHLLEARLGVLRETYINRIEQRLGNLRAASGDLPIADARIQIITPESIPGMSTTDLFDLDCLLTDELHARTGQSGTAKLAENLIQSWEAQTLNALFEGLAAEKLDTESVLLLISINASYPSQTIPLTEPIFDSLLRGVQELSDSEDIFGVLSYLAYFLTPEALRGWSTLNEQAQARLCLVFLASDHASTHRLPDNFLWQLPVEWPLDGMPGWSRIWQAALEGTPLPIITAGTQEQDQHVKQARQAAEQQFEQERGLFIHLRTVKSNRHRELLHKKFMPDLLAGLERFKQYEAQIRQMKHEPLIRLLPDLEKEIARLNETYAEDNLIDRYETGVYEDGIDDSDTFHRRTALKVFQESVQALLDYGQAVLAFAKARAQGDKELTRLTLEAELRRVPHLLALGAQVIICLGENHEIERESQNTDQAYAEALAWLVSRLLSQAVYAKRLPRVLGSLTGARLDGGAILPILLQDIAAPVTAIQAAHILFELAAPDQLLLLAQDLPLDMQKQAQELRAERQQAVTQLENELLRREGRVDDLASERDLGRWQLVCTILEQRLEDQKHSQERVLDERRREIRQLRADIQKLDNDYFEVESTIPRDAYQLVQRGLDLARLAINRNAYEAFDAVRGYLSNTGYRLSRGAWALTEMEDWIGRLESTINGQTTSQESVLSSAQILDLLERNELQRLGLSPKTIELSEIETRINLVRNWLAVRAGTGFHTDSLKPELRTAISFMFSYFARMVSMRRIRTSDGRVYEADNPAPHAYWSLEYPRTDALAHQCVLMALPGNPPGPAALRDLENLLDHKTWLEDGFVFVFAPGCTSDQVNRLKSNYSGLRLVIINEQVMIDIVLANARASYPLGQLRPLMLHTIAGETDGIFTINQLVRSRNAIFVGRDTLIRRLASSGDNYALYGGRRIGKSSVLAAVHDRLLKEGTRTIWHSFEGEGDCSDLASARKLADLLKLPGRINSVADFKTALQSLMDSNPDLSVAFMLDEIDQYIVANPSRHLLIETLRALSDQYTGRLRTIVAGFINLYYCRQGHGPYTPNSDPWQRMFTSENLGNLTPVAAEEIVNEGFRQILGWRFENPALPQWIVERTGGHPAFVQDFCLKLQQRVGLRGDRLIRFEDVEAVFNDLQPEESFIAYVQSTLDMNLDSIAQYLILWLAQEPGQKQGFTMDEMRDYAGLCQAAISEERLERSLDRLTVTSVVKKRGQNVYDFSVPDYPRILKQLGQTDLLDELDTKIAMELSQQQ